MRYARPLTRRGSLNQQGPAAGEVGRGSGREGDFLALRFNMLTVREPSPAAETATSPEGGLTNRSIFVSRRR
jgi:hypothetical protein